MTNRFKLARTAHNQHGKQSVNEVKIATGIQASLINDIEAENPIKPRGVSYLVVKKLAQHYGVSSDYLLGLTDISRSCEKIDFKGMVISSAVGERVRSIRKIRGESQQDIADALGVKRETVKFWESGDRHIKENDIIKLAKHFCISADDLLGLSDHSQLGTEIRAIEETEELIKTLNAAVNRMKHILTDGKSYATQRGAKHER